MNENVAKIYKSNNDLWGLPQVYKGIKFYPLRISDYDKVGILYSIFGVPKNHIPDKTVLKMFFLKYYLAYLPNMLQVEPEQVANMLTEFLSHVTQMEVRVGYKVLPKEMVDPKNPFSTFEFYLYFGEDIIISEYEFEDIREIILYQNGLSYEWVEQFNPELEDRLFQYQKDQPLDFEDQVYIFCSMLRKTVNEIKDYTLIQFRRHYERMGLLENYELMAPLEMSGQIKSKNGKQIVKPYNVAINKIGGRYDSILISRQEFDEEHHIMEKE